MRNKIVDLVDDQITVTFPYDKTLARDIGAIPTETKWDKKKFRWVVPRLDILSLDQFKQFIKTHSFEMTGRAKTHLDQTQKRFKNSQELSVATTSDYQLPKGRFPLNIELYPYQIAGVEYALANRKTFIADQMGLGKTYQALATVNLLDAFPLLVICKAGLKLTWVNEIRKLMTGVKLQLLSNPTTLIPGMDIYIMNYDILASGWEQIGKGKRKKVILSPHAKQLSEMGLQCIIADESHYFKNSASQRTKAAQILARGVPTLLALTGTPWLNRPAEIIAQLQWLDKLREFGGWHTFATRYCKLTKTRFGTDISGAANEYELNDRLRSICYVRRKKEQVLLDLPEKQRSNIILTLDNRTEYDQAKNDLIGWLQDQGKDVEGVSKVIKLAKLNYLRQLSAQGKLKQAITWIRDFVATGEKVIVFAYHIAIQEALVDAFPEFADLVSYKGDIYGKEAEKERFMTDETCMGIICSLGSDKEGHTLTAASNVVFLELDWTPANLEQAEDRAHRIGQSNAVNIWYLLAEDSIDTRLNLVLEEKRNTIMKVTDGNHLLFEDLIEEYMNSDPLSHD